MSAEPRDTKKQPERVLLCGVLLEGQPVETEGPLSEAAGLAVAAGCEVVGERVVQRRDRPEPATMMGKGKVREVQDEIELHKPDAVIVDNDLTPGQVRNLEKAWCKRVVDRSELIMDIFATRAQTRQARLQVELAQTQYLMPRLRRMWTHLERTEGAIGTRGPGETQLETDRRLLRDRVSDLRGELREIEARKRRQVRSRSDEFTIGLVGYTNAGKSTLLNRLTGAGEFAADMLFATLDTRTRRWKLSDGRRVLLSDTVGFLQRLPHHLVASFNATLEEALEVDLLMHVVDASHADAVVHVNAVDKVLRTLSAAPREELLVLNKADAVEDPVAIPTILGTRDEGADWVQVSAKTGLGLDDLERIITTALDRRSARVELEIPFTEGGFLAAFRQVAVIEAEDHDAERGTLITARVADRELGNLLRKSGEGVTCRVIDPPVEPYVREGLESEVL